jgi:hypothetical protein
MPFDCRQQDRFRIRLFLVAPEFFERPGDAEIDLVIPKLLADRLPPTECLRPVTPVPGDARPLNPCVDYVGKPLDGRFDQRFRRVQLARFHQADRALDT